MLHNAELYALLSSPNIIRNLKLRRLRLAKHVARLELFRNACIVSVGKPEGKKRRWEDNIKMNLREGGCDAGNGIDLAQDRVHWQANARTVVNKRVS